MAPILSFTAEEAYGHLHESLRTGAETVFALRFAPEDAGLEQAERDRWETLLAIRGAVSKAAEPLRKSGQVGHSLGTALTLYAPDEVMAGLAMPGVDLPELFIVSQVHVRDADEAPADAFVSEEVPGLRLTIAAADGGKCERCWKYSTELGTLAQHPETCPRCAAVLKDLQA